MMTAARMKARQSLSRKASHRSLFLLLSPSGDICEYFGMKIAFYFSWLGHYTTALCIPALVGVFFWVSPECVVGKMAKKSNTLKLTFILKFFLTDSGNEFLEDLGFVLFAFFNVIWATLYLESWQVKSGKSLFLAHCESCFLPAGSVVPQSLPITGAPPTRGPSFWLSLGLSSGERRAQARSRGNQVRRRNLQNKCNCDGAQCTVLLFSSSPSQTSITLPGSEPSSGTESPSPSSVFA